MSPLQAMPDRISLVAVGATGQGKSTLGNILVATEQAPFEISDSFDSQTRRCSHADFDDGDAQYRFVDTVGFFDTKMTPDLVYNKFAEFSDRVPGGVDVFLYVEQKGRFNEEQLKRFNVFKEYVGPEALQHTLLVFTRIRNHDLSQQLKRDEDEGRMPKALKEVLSQVKGVVGVESLNKAGVARRDVLKAAQTLVQQLSGRTYANQALQEAEERRRTLQDVVSRLAAGERRSAMEHALKGLYDGSRTFDEVRGTILHAEICQQKEQTEERLREAEKTAAELRSQTATLKLEVDHHSKESQRVQEEHRAAKEEHSREKQEWKRAEEERARQVEEERKRRDEEHGREKQEWKEADRAAKEEHSRAKQEWKQAEEERTRQFEEDARRRDEEHSQQKQEWKQAEQERKEEHGREKQEWKRAEEERTRQFEEDRRRLHEERTNEVAKVRSDAEAQRLALELSHQARVAKHEEDLKQRSDEMERVKRQHHDAHAQLQRQHTATAKHGQELEEMQVVISSQRSTIQQQQEMIETLQVQRLAAAAAFTACFFTTVYALRRR